MNFLAHLYLSGYNEKVMVGNFIGDFVKGKQYENYEPGIKKGILLHRHIDAFTDVHPKVIASKRRLWEKYRHYAGVIVDIFYDHFLAVNWSVYHQMPLVDYTQKAYKIILAHETTLPKGAKYMLPFMMENNWLLNYAQKEGIRQALTGMARRATFQSKMGQAAHDLTLHYDDFEKDFKDFFPDVIIFAGDWLKEN
ncbi:MAG: ACP phosphodiesterase [Fulvivirga sp.]